MTEKWTPGEWAVDGNSIIGPDRQIVAISTGEDFGGYFGDDADVDAEQRANAHLIAAAPDMAADHAENSRILGYLLNELQGLVPAGKLAALAGCKERSDRSYAKARGEA